MFVELLSLNYVFAFGNFSKMKQKEETWSTQMKNMRRNGSNCSYSIKVEVDVEADLNWEKLAVFETQIIPKLFTY
jgi:hypothetical protein